MSNDMLDSVLNWVALRVRAKRYCYRLDGMESKMHCFIGYDKCGVGRVYAQHPNVDVAETWCIEECFKYIKHRRETGPYSKWVVLKAAPVKQGVCRSER